MIEQAADERAAVQKPSPLFRGEGHARTWQAFRENVAAFLPRDPSGAQGESRKAESAGRHDLLRFLPLIAVFLARRRSHRERSGRYHHHLWGVLALPGCVLRLQPRLPCTLKLPGTGRLTLPYRYRPHPLVGRVPARLCCVRCVDELPLSPAAHDGRAFGRKRSVRYCGTLFCSDSNAC
jgi:hypothetical protein